MKWILPALILLTPFPALAEKPYKAGLNHTRLYVTPKPEKPETPEAEKPEVERPELTASGTPRTEEESAADKVWKKYKKLAMGQDKVEDAKADDKASDDKPKKTKEVSKQQVGPSKAGFSSILETYQKNKESRKDMRTISFNPPEVQTKKPE